jgi:hypothetical protein
MTSSWRKGAVLPVLVGVLAAAITAYVSWLFVRSDVARWSGAGFTVGPEMKLVFFFSGAAGITGFFLGRRLRGPSVTCKEWLLIVPRLTASASRVLSIQDLLTRLAARGYRLTAAGVDLEGNKLGSMHSGTPFSDVAVVLIDERLGSSPAGLVLRIGERTAQANALCTVEARDRRGSGYAELARFVIAEMDSLTPGVTYKRSDSALSPDPAAELRAVLPATPRGLAGR